MRFKLTNEKIREALGLPKPEFPKYTSQLVNLASWNAQATRPKAVGQMTELIKEFPGKTLEEWEAWYRGKHPQTLSNATDRILPMVCQLRQAIDLIDRELVERWVRDLVIVKTFTGLRFQEAILKKIAETRGEDYRCATPEEESHGIDGYIGNKAVSIKPHTYKSKAALPESLEAIVVYYEKGKDHLFVDCDDL